MHGTFREIQAVHSAYDATFDEFVGDLYADGTVPPVMVVQDECDAAEYFKRTGSVPVLLEDESADCAVFGNWGTHYAFWGWVAYRAMYKQGNEFQSMVTDVLDHCAWEPRTAHWIGIINCLVEVQEEYADKFGHYPVDLKKFVKSYIKYGADTVLRGDLY